MLSHRALLANHAQLAAIDPPPVTPDDVGRVVDRVLGSGERTLALVGPPDTLPA